VWREEAPAARAPVAREHIEPEARNH